MKYYVYIIFSEKFNRYYMGGTENPEERLRQHNQGFYKKAFTSAAKDWKLMLKTDCNNKSVAKKIEKQYT